MRLWMVNIPTLIVLGMTLGMISLIVTKTYIFESIRDWIAEKSDFWGTWIQCPVCFGTWITFISMWLAGPVAQTPLKFLDWIITWFFLDFISCLSAGILYKLYKSND